MRHPLADLHGWVGPPAVLVAALVALAGLAGLHYNPPTTETTWIEEP